jgi:hypothetical protein
MMMMMMIKAMERLIWPMAGLMLVLFRVVAIWWR